MPNARLAVIPGGGHRPDIRSPKLVHPLLLEFLVKVGRKREHAHQRYS